MPRQYILLLDTIVLGIVGAAGAQLFVLLLHLFQGLFLTHLAGYTPLDLSSGHGVIPPVIGGHGLWLVPVVTTLGGLVSGVLVYGLAPEAEGHGTDTAVRAFHRASGFIRKRVTPLKILASAITIGSGGSAGREGPTALFSAGVGSIYAGLFHRSDTERRLLVLIGMAAGLSAIFRSPIGTAIFAVEVLYGEMEFEGEALIYTMLGSIVAYAVNGLFAGWEPLFRVPAGLEVRSIYDYGWYIVLGLGSGVVGAILPNVFYLVRDGFRKIPIPPHVKPAIGGLLVGLIALALPQVLGGGYAWIQEAIDGHLALGILALLVVAKTVAFALTVSSGGSGGVFAPTLFVGAMLGAAGAHLFHQSPAAFAVIGMAAVFGSAARIPIATLLMITEMTGGYSLLVPAALAVILAFLVQRRLSSRLKYTSLYEAQVPHPPDSPAHRTETLMNALRMLEQRRPVDLGKIGHLHLMRLLENEVPIDLGEDEQLVIGRLSPASPCAGRRIEECPFAGDEAGVEVVAIFRQEQMVLPHPNTVLAADDEILVLTPSVRRMELDEHFRPHGARAS